MSAAAWLKQQATEASNGARSLRIAWPLRVGVTVITGSGPECLWLLQTARGPSGVPNDSWYRKEPQRGKLSIAASPGLRKVIKLSLGRAGTVMGHYGPSPLVRDGLPRPRPEPLQKAIRLRREGGMVFSVLELCLASAQERTWQAGRGEPWQDSTGKATGIALCTQLCCIWLWCLSLPDSALL